MAKKAYIDVTALKLLKRSGGRLSLVGTKVLIAPTRIRSNCWMTSSRYSVRSFVVLLMKTFNIFGLQWWSDISHETSRTHLSQGPCASRTVDIGPTTLMARIGFCQDGQHPVSVSWPSSADSVTSTDSNGLCLVVTPLSTASARSTRPPARSDYYLLSHRASKARSLAILSGLCSALALFR